MKQTIVVIADDLTGAAEIAGIGLRYQFSVEIVTDEDLNTDADLLVISANTRSLSEEDARKKVKSIAQKLNHLKPFLLFKKIDSVLRGHVLGEIQEILIQIPFEKTLVLPANPSLDRTIIEGNYFVKGVPISETSFAYDPEFAIKNSSVLDMIRTTANEVKVESASNELAQNSISIGNCQSNADLDLWVQQINSQTLLVGAADFFNAILKKYFADKFQAKNVFKEQQKSSKILYISGTTFGKSVAEIRGKYLKNEPVSYLPKVLIASENQSILIEKWSEDIRHLLQKNQEVIMAIGDLGNSGIAPQQLAQLTALVAKKVVQTTEIQSLLIEGGATAAAVLEALSLTHLIPTHEFAQGVIQMKSKDNRGTNITIKPGSYEWPSEIWKF